MNYKNGFFYIKILSILFFIFPLLATPSLAELKQRGIDPLYVERGARPLALGGAFIAIADDSNTGLFNPAGLARSKGIAVTLANAGGVVAAQAYPTGFGWTLGLALVNFQLNEMPYAGGTTNYNSNIVVFSFGSRLSFLKFLGGDVWDRIDFGLSYKDIMSMSLRQTGESDKSADGWDMDAGILMELNDWIKVGGVFKNFLAEGGDVQYGGVLKWASGSMEAFPASFKLGTSMKIIGDIKSPIYMEGNELVITSDLDFSLTEEKPMLVHLGAEWLYQGKWAARAGLDQRMNEKEEVEGNFTFGLGYRTLPWGVDLTYHPGLFENDSSVYFSVLYWPEEWVFVRKPREQIERERREAEEREKREEIKEEELVEFIGPQDNLVTDGDFVEIEGKVKPGSTVYVNGNPVFVGSDGKIKARVPLYTGKNLVEIVTEYGGKRKVIKRHVLKQPKVVVAEEAAVEKELEEIKPKEQELKREEEEIERISKKEELEAAEKKAIEERKAKLIQEKQKLVTKKKEIEKKKEVIVEKKQKLKNLATLGVIDIEPEKEYKLEERITRGELAMWLVKAKGLSITRLKEDPFKDVSRTNLLAPYIKAVVDAGLMKGYPDGTFRPKDGVTEKEGLVILKRFNELR